MVQTDDERKAKVKLRRQTPEYKAKEKLRRQTPEYKAKKREYDKTPERKAKKREYGKTPESRSYDKLRNQKPERKAKVKLRQQTPEYKAKAKENEQRPERKAKRRERHSKPEYVVKMKDTRVDKRLKVLQHYSKLISKSDIPCCNCCGLNSYVEFLAIDHIAGRFEMDSEHELVKLGYSSKKSTNSLLKWIIDNNFPKGFQILCHNCNSAKGFYGKCPLENKPH